MARGREQTQEYNPNTIRAQAPADARKDLLLAHDIVLLMFSTDENDQISLLRSSMPVKQDPQFWYGHYVVGTALAFDEAVHNNTSTMPTLVSIANLKSECAAPRYEQIAKAVSQAICSGQLKPGDRLPTVRALASDLGVSLTTVTAAFKSLAENGWTRGEIGRGTFVSERGGDDAPPAGSVPGGTRLSQRIRTP